ncbi:MAG: hypothetical protein FWE35_10285 [Streptosporangiales bacterium]|nr:hypothetical protein [Streptosporangiales bacterium]
MSEKTTTLIVFASPAEGKEAEFNDWYDNVHLGEFVALPGVESGQRFDLAPASPPAKTGYAAIYQLSGDPAEVMKAMDAAIKDGSMHMSDAIDPASVAITAWTPHGPVATS